MKKILILAMSCNLEFFANLEKNIKSLYAKDILEGKYENIDFWIYTASKDDKYHVNHKTHKLYVPCDDSLDGTYEKTFKTFNLIQKLGFEFDYVLRTNLSTYINVNLLNKFINEAENLDDKKIYAGMLYCTQYATGPYEWCLYGCGNSLIIPRFWFDVIAKNNVAKYKQSNYTVNPSGDVYYKIDDNTIGLVVNSYALMNKIDMYDVWMNIEFPSYGEPVIEPLNFLVIPFREYKPDNSRDLEETKSRIIHTVVENTETTKDVNDILKHQEVHIIDFNKKMDSVVTRELADKFMTCLSLPKYIKNLAINNKRYNTLS